MFEPQIVAMSTQGRLIRSMKPTEALLAIYRSLAQTSVRTELHLEKYPQWTSTALANLICCILSCGIRPIGVAESVVWFLDCL